MDALKELTQVLHQVDPMKIKSPNKDEYSSEAADVLKEFQFINTTDRLVKVLVYVFTKSFSKKDAAIDWKPTVKAIMENKVLGAMLSKLNGKAQAK